MVVTERVLRGQKIFIIITILLPLIFKMTLLLKIINHPRKISKYTYLRVRSHDHALGKHSIFINIFFLFGSFHLNNNSIIGGDILEFFFWGGGAMNSIHWIIILDFIKKYIIKIFFNNT